MNVPSTLLGLLESGASHGYELKREYDALFSRDKPLSFGQVYGTLGRLERDGYVAVEGTAPGDGPDRKRYVITSSGVALLERWLREPERPDPYLQPVLFTKVVLALTSGRPAAEYLDAQRAAHMAHMRALTAERREGGLTDALVADYALFHLQADLQWIDLTTQRLDQLAKEISQ
jgi:DNA-binding PadR family transcriptional regulator